MEKFAIEKIWIIGYINPALETIPQPAILQEIPNPFLKNPPFSFENTEIIDVK